MSNPFSIVDTLYSHTDWVTQVAISRNNPNILVSSSRDKSLVIWNLPTRKGATGIAKKSLTGHNGFVSDVVLSSDGLFALSGSWDHTLRLWDLNTGRTTRQFRGHTNDVLSVAFSSDDRQIVSGSRDRTAKMWNTLGHCKMTFEKNGHTDWVSCVRFSPSIDNPLVVTCGWDKMVKVWNLNNCLIRTNHIGHSGYLNTVVVAPDGTLCASGGKDGRAMLWDLGARQFLYTLEAGGEIKSLCFSPSHYWLCAAVGSTIKIWDLSKKTLIDELKTDQRQRIECQCLTWSNDGSRLYAGYSDGAIRVWEVANTMAIQ